MAASTTVKKIEYHGVWIYTTIVSILAFVWYFLVLIVISPNVIELWEAAVSFCLVFIFIVIGYAIDRKTDGSKEVQKGIVPIEIQPQELDVDYHAAKCTLRNITKCYGEIDVIRAAKGEKPDSMKKKVISDIRENF